MNEKTDNAPCRRCELKTHRKKNASADKSSKTKIRLIRTRGAAIAKKKPMTANRLRRISGDWNVTTDSTLVAAVATGDDLLSKVLASKQFVVEGSIRAEGGVTEAFARRRAVLDPTLVLEVEPKPGEAFILAVRHSSGALRFELPQAVPVRRAAGGAAKTALRFRINPGIGADDQSRRRSIVGDIVSAILLRVARPLIDAAVATLASAWETRVWAASKKNLGFVHLDTAGLKSGSLRPIAGPAVFTPPPQKNLLLIHGTFSCAESFGQLATTRGSSGQTFLDLARELYQDRVFAFNHFTVSKTPEENAKNLLTALPKNGAIFDVVTHSRGGLVLRTLVELAGRLGEASDRFNLGQAILVASPNEGTPLAQPGRFHGTLNLLANLLELFPQNPFTFGADLVIEGLKWIATAVGESIPGLASMNPDGGVIAALEGFARARPAQYAALAANYRATGNILARLSDLGLDAFFAGANDLVVPTEGGWRLADGSSTSISTDRIGCFGPGGNLDSGNTPVNHVNFFALPGTIDFLERALRSESPFAKPPIDPWTNLPFGLRRRGIGLEAEFVDQPEPESALTESEVTPEPIATSEDRHAKAVEKPCQCDEYPLDEILHLFVISRDTSGEIDGDGEKEHVRPDVRKNDSAKRRKDHEGAQIIASFRNARVIEPFVVSRKTERAQSGLSTPGEQDKPNQEGHRWQRMIAMNKRIENWTLGKVDSELPDRLELISFGVDLFETLFPGEIRRMYDAARAELRDRRLAVVLTTMFPWMAVLPWEFSYDPARETFLCMEDINFLRNIVTAVPADAIPPRSNKLQILVIAAQPIGTIPLSVQEESAVIRRAFERLEAAELAEVTIIPKATIDDMHCLLEQAADFERPFDILHFIGHGEFDEKEFVGRLLFEDDRGGRQPLPAETLRQIVRQRGIRLIFLNACETGRGDMGMRKNQPEVYVGGVAPALVKGGVPSVVANQYSVLDPSAAAFASHFYWSLASGRRVGDAAREARIAVNYSITGEAIDWAVPVLYARNPGERLIRRTQQTIARAWKGMEARRTRRHSGLGRVVRIGVWDINYAIPNLEQILGRLNEVQGGCEFEVITAPAPMGTWRCIQDDDGGMVIDGDEVIKRLSGTPAAWGVKGMLCITGFRLQGRCDGALVEDDLFLYGDFEKGIAIGSIHSFVNEFKKPGFFAGRFVANMLVAMLNPADTHKKNQGPKDCPNYYNDELDPESVFGKLTFCKKCRDQIKKRRDWSSVDQETLNKLLSAY